MSLELIDEKSNNQIKEKLRCYLKVVFPKNTEIKNKEIMKFYDDNQEAIFKKTKIILGECSTPVSKNIKSSGGRKKTKSIRNHKTKTRKTRKTRRKKGGSLMDVAAAVTAVTIGMFFAFFFTLALVPTGMDHPDE
jgi:hypothetical protein|tara:strand:- start:2214 stop:2618 length:405 start_codon:yes stop_codon:yes gene_type:complete